MVWDTTQSTLYTLNGAVERHNADYAENMSESAAVPTEPYRGHGEQKTNAPTEGDNGERLPAQAHTEPSELPAAELDEPPSPPIRAVTERVEAPCDKCPCEKHGEAPAKAECPQNPCEDCPRRCPKCGKPLPAPKSSNPIEALLADKDTLLLAALILLLWHEKADIKLIGALAFIMLSN